jgi:hypothetical protein
MPAGVVDKDSTHGRRGDCHEVGPARPLRAAVVDEPHVGLVHERRRAQGVSVGLPPKLLACEPAELVVDQREHVGEGGRVARTSLREQLRNRRSGPIRHEEVIRTRERGLAARWNSRGGPKIRRGRRRGNARAGEPGAIAMRSRCRVDEVVVWLLLTPLEAWWPCKSSQDGGWLDSADSCA